MDIWECALGFMDSQMLLTAEELGLFARLDEAPMNAKETGAAIGLPEDSALRLLTALCALGIVRKAAGGRFENAPEAAEQLVPGKEGYIGALFDHVRQVLYPAWGHFRTALEQGKAPWSEAFAGKPVPTEALFSDPDALRQFMAGMQAITHRSAVEFAGQARELDQVRTLVDVGGAGGALVIGLTKAFPDLRATVFDLPAVRPIAEENFSNSGHSERLTFVEGDFWEDDLPAGADAYALSCVLHDWETEGGSRILGKISEAARPGSLLILAEALLNDDRCGPLFVARQDLNMLVSARGRERSAREYADWIRRFGFEVGNSYGSSLGRSFLVATRKA